MSPEQTLMLRVLFGMAAIYWSLHAVEIWVLHRRLPRVTGGLAIAFAAAIFVVAPRPPVPRSPASEQARVDLMHRELAPALERYRQAHGEYPPTLRAAGIATPRTRYGGLHYYGSRNERPPWYVISFGDPARHGFSADWDSRTQKWTQVFIQVKSGVW